MGDKGLFCLPFFILIFPSPIFFGNHYSLFTVYYPDVFCFYIAFP